MPWGAADALPASTSRAQTHAIRASRAGPRRTIPHPIGTHIRPLEPKIAQAPLVERIFQPGNGLDRLDLALLAERRREDTRERHPANVRLALDADLLDRSAEVGVHPAIEMVRRLPHVGDVHPAVVEADDMQLHSLGLALA